MSCVGIWQNDREISKVQFNEIIFYTMVQDTILQYISPLQNRSFVFCMAHDQIRYLNYKIEMATHNII